MKRVALALLALAACGERVTTTDNRTTPNLERAESASATTASPVRIGEAGPAFRACQASGTPRGGDLPVRSAPFESAGVSGRIAPGARFFVCSRSIDQRWMGVVFEPGGTLSPGCGVSAPIARRTGYAGPCASGWVMSAAVRLVAA